MRLRDIVRERGLWLLTGLVAVLFWRPLTFETFFFRDLYLLIYPKKLFFATAIRSGELPLWDPFTNGGQPYLASPGNFAFHPTNLLYLVLPPIIAFNWILVLHVAACAVFAYWLARTIQLSQPAAFVTGAVFALSGFALSTLNLMPWLLGLPWLPLTIGLLHRALRDGRSVAPAALAAAMPLYGGAAEAEAILFVTMIVWTFTADGLKAVPHRARAVGVASVMVLALGLAALPILPATSVIAQSSRALRRSYESFTSWSVNPRRLPELVVPQFLGPTGTLDDRDYWGRGIESQGFPYVLSIYFGVSALLLATSGAIAQRRALAALAALALLLSVGQWLPGFRLIYELPFVATFRYPVKLIGAALLPVAILAGCGVEALSRRWAVVATVVGAMAGGVAIAIGMSEGFAATFAERFAFQTLAPAALARSFIHVAVFAFGFAVAASLPRYRQVALAAVVALDLTMAGSRVNVFAPRSIFDEPPIAATVRRLAGDGRYYAAPRPIRLVAPTNELFWLARWQIATLTGYTAAMFRIPVIYHADYDGLAPWRVARLTEAVNRLPWPQRRPLLDVADVTVFSSTDAVALPGIEEAETLREPGQTLHLYANRAARAANFAGPCGGASVRLVRRTLNGSTYEVDAPCDGLVALAETRYDGWRTTIDGVDAEVLPANFAFSAVRVRQGRHTIVRTYRPPRLAAGAIITAISLLLLAWVRVRA